MVQGRIARTRLPRTSAATNRLATLPTRRRGRSSAGLIGQRTAESAAVIHVAAGPHAYRYGHRGTGMALTDAERRFLAAAPVGRLATADGDGHPHVVPVCFALVDDGVVTPIDEKPKDARLDRLRRVRDIDANPQVALVVDHYEADWTRLGWVQVRGTATLVDPDDAGHGRAVDALRAAYDQYRDHALDDRPLIRIAIGHAVSWGTLDPVA